jgi:hypothetical protein
MGRDGRLRVARERETPLHQSPQAGAQLRRIEQDRSTVAGQADGFLIGDGLSYASRPLLVGAEIVTDKSVLQSNSNLSPVLWIAGQACAWCVRGSIFFEIRMPQIRSRK